MVRTVRQSGRKGGDTVGQLVAAYSDFVKNVGKELEDILTEAADIVLQKTIPFVPVETGALRESGVVIYESGSDFNRAVVQFGGDTPVSPTINAPEGTVNYALIVHEDMEANHTVGQAKFLEAGAVTAKQEVEAFVLRRLREINANKEAKRAARNAKRRKSR